MTVSKTVFIGAVAFVPAAILHGCGGDDKNKQNAQTGVRDPAGGDNGGTENQLKKFTQKVQNKVKENLGNMDELKQLVKDKNYSGAWTKLTTDFPQMAKKLVKQTFSKGEGKTAENLTKDDQNKCVQKLHDDLFGEEAPEPLASTAGASSKDTSAPEAGDSSDQVDEDRNRIAEAIEAKNYDEAVQALSVLEMTEVDLREMDPVLFEKFQAIKPEEDDDAAIKALTEAIDAGNYDQVQEVLDKLDMAEENLQELDEELFKKFQAIKPPATTDTPSTNQQATDLSEDQGDAAEVDEEQLKKLLQDFLKEKGVESSEGLTFDEQFDKLTDDQQREFVDLLHLKEEGDFKPVAERMDGAASDKISAAFKKYADINGEDEAETVYNRIMMDFAEEKGKSLEDLTPADFDEADFKKIAQQLNDHTFEFDGHLEKAQATDKVAEKVFAALKEIVRLEEGDEAAEEVETNFPKMLEAFVREKYPADKEKTAADLTEEQKKEFVENLKAKEIEELKGILQDKSSTPEQKENATLILKALEQAETAPVPSKSAAPKTGSRNGLRRQTLDAGSD